MEREQDRLNIEPQATRATQTGPGVAKDVLSTVRKLNCFLFSARIESRLCDRSPSTTMLCWLYEYVTEGSAGPGRQCRGDRKKEEEKSSHRMAFVLVRTMLLGRIGKKAKGRVGQIAHDVGC